MPDDKPDPGGQDRRRIHTGEDDEVRDEPWKFGVTPHELKAAAGAVGDEASAVEARLKGKR